MKSPILLIDCNYLAYRAWYSTGGLSHNGEPSGVIYGFLRTIIELQDQFHPGAFCFCWDHGKLLRQVDYPEYKANREEKPQELKEQMDGLRKVYLKKLGYNNIWYSRGYEADDLIASTVLNPKYRSINRIIVSSDHDLYQLLGKSVSIWNPASKRIITKESFTKEFGIEPSQWVDCKSIAGCKTDNISGIQGVGEKTAAKFISGKLSPDSKAFREIVKGNSIWQKNMHLVRLPYPGLREREIKEDTVNIVNWRQLAQKFGMKSLQDKAPVRKEEGLGII